MRSRGKWMGPEDGSRNGKRRARELCGPDGARRSIAVTSRAVSFGIWRSPGWRPKNGCYEPEYIGNGREPGRRAQTPAKKSKLRRLAWHKHPPLAIRPQGTGHPRPALLSAKVRATRPLPGFG